MSKLDEIDYETYSGLQPEDENGKHIGITPKTREHIKKAFLDILPDNEGINPHAKDFYDGYSLAIKEIKDRIELL